MPKLIFYECFFYGKILVDDITEMDVSEKFDLAHRISSSSTSSAGSLFFIFLARVVSTFVMCCTVYCVRVTFY